MGCTTANTTADTSFNFNTTTNIWPQPKKFQKATLNPKSVGQTTLILYTMWILYLSY